MGERLGIFGGTFDPPHVGHLVTAVNVRHELHLDRVLLVVNDQPWQKLGTRDITPAEDRFAMVEAAVGKVEGIEASRLEIERGGMSYTADTLGTLRAEDADRELFVVLGSDAARGLPTWERVDEVRELATIVVVERPGSVEAAPFGVAMAPRHGVEGEPRPGAGVGRRRGVGGEPPPGAGVARRRGVGGEPPPGWSWTRVEVPRLEVSSTDLRARVADGRPLDYLLSAEVIETIAARGLYRGQGAR
jgi:nicotinate-nucleotide adenylyltransferase